MYRSLILHVLVLGVVAWCGQTLTADTVYLKNGNWIDGIVEPRDGNSIVLVIGDMGRLEIDKEDIYEIEKNSRTGSRARLPVDDRDVDLDVGGGGDDDEKSGENVKQASGDGSGEGGQGNQGDEVGEEGGEGETGESGDTDPETDSLDPELKSRIEKLVADLQRQKSKFRVRAERHLRAVGAPSIPFLLPVATHESDLVRVSVFRLFHNCGDESVIEVAISALLDSNEHVRDYAHRTLQRVTEEDFGYKPLASPRRREYAHKKWETWWEEEKAALKELRDKANKGDANTESSEHKKK